MLSRAPPPRRIKRVSSWAGLCHRYSPAAGSDKMRRMDPFLAAAIEEAKQGLSEGGIPIGAVLVHENRVIGRGHNRRVQQGSAILHGEMDALERAGRLPEHV